LAAGEAGGRAERGKACLMREVLGAKDILGYIRIYIRLFCFLFRARCSSPCCGFGKNILARSTSLHRALVPPPFVWRRSSLRQLRGHWPGLRLRERQAEA